MKKLNTIFGCIGLVIFLSWDAAGQISPNSNTTTNTTPYANVYLSNLVSPTAVSQDLLPRTTNYYNLGNSTKTWKGLYAGTINATGNASIGGTFKVTGLSTLNSLKLNGFGAGFLKTNSSGQVSSALITAGDIPPLPYLKLTGGTLTGALNGTGATFSGNVTAASFIKSGGTSSQILAANGSVITAGSGITISGGTISSSGGGINSLNGLKGSTQTFATGTTGTNFTIVSSGTTHTFNIPSASAANRGLLTSADWNTFNGKQAPVTLTTTGSSGPATFIGNTLNIPVYTSGGSGGWSLTGNSGTVDGTNFIGTTDDVPLSFKVNNTLSGRIESSSTANTFFGYGSGGVNNTGLGNTATGYQALYSNTDGGANTANGWRALYSNISGNYNTAIGSAALNSNTTGELNTAIGDNALGINISGNNNTAIGLLALYTNITGNNLTALGYRADVNADGLTNSTAIGAGSIITASNTIQLGNASVTKVFAGTGTTATVVAGGLQVTGGTLAAGKVLTSDASGVATWQSPSPSGSGWSLTGNSGTVDGTNFIGTTDEAPLSFKIENTLSGRIDRFSNTFFGFESPVNNTGFANTATGSQALFFNTTGVINTAYGVQALLSNSTGSRLTAVGSSADVNADGYTNSTAIGNGAIIDASNVIILGNTSITAIKANVTSITSLSDRRFKKNVTENVPGLEFIKLLKPVTYNYDIKGLNAHRAPNTAAMKVPNGKQAIQASKPDVAAISKKEMILYSGLVAQDVEAAANKIGYDFSGLYKPRNDKDAYGLGYADFVVPLIKATQELSSANDKLQGQVADLQNQLKEIKAQLAGMVKGGVSSGSAILSNARLEQNIPNPFKKTTQINYSIPQTAGSAMIVVTGMNGEKIKTVSVNSKGAGQLTLQTAQLAAGTYSYSLYVDGNLIDSKKMILTK